MAELADGKMAAGNGKMKCSAEIFIANPPSHPQKIHSPPAPPIPNSSPQNHSILHGFLYSALWLLFALQLLAILKNHSHLGGLTMFDTILLIIVKAEPKKVPLRWIFGAKDSIPPSANLMRPFLFFVGGIVFLALLFVNFTHAMEAISCADSSSHFSAQFVGMVLLNFIAKFPLLFCSFQLSIPDISLQSRLLLHFGPSLVTLALFAANWHFSRADDFLISHLDRYFGAGLCFLLAVAIFPIFRFNLPYLLCDSPEGMDKEDLKMEIEKKFQQIRCQHLHIYCQWPSSKSFNIFAKIQMHLGENEENEFGKIMLELREMLKEKGAQKMSIEPIVTIKGEKMNRGGGNLRLICVNENCQMKERTCCDGQNEGKIKGEMA